MKSSFLSGIEPKWVELDVIGEESGFHYTGRFQVKPFLTNAEKADASRLASGRCVGIDNPGVVDMLVAVSLLSFYIKDSENAPWYKPGVFLDIPDVSPISQLSEKIAELRPKKKEEEENDKEAQV